MKKFVIGVLACTMICGAVPYVNYLMPENNSITANAVDYTKGTFESLTYKAYSDHIEISGCDKSATEVTIPSEIDGLPVTTIGDSAFAYCTRLTSIIIPENVTSIENNAFSNCAGLKSITMPDSVISIEIGAFSYCTNLTSITISENVTSIQMLAFDGCYSLAEINVSDNNKNYISKDGILFNKEMTELLKYPQGKLETEYIISDSVSSIGSWAFDGCKNLKSITISDNVEKIGSFSFDDCTSLTEINVSDNNKNYIDTDGILFNKKMNELLKYPQEKPKTEYIIPDSVTNIESSAFSGCTGLTEVTIPNSVTRIAYEAFSGCTGLTSITIPDSVKSIESSAFSNCTGLTSIVIPDSITSIRNWAFDSCTNLKSITILDSVTSIEMNAFSRCTGLTSITIPQSVISIGAWAFYGCTSLKSITIPDSVTSIGYSAFHYCKSLTSITIKNPECEIYDNSATISDTTTIYGYENSTAQAYAETYERNFVSLTEAPTGSSVALAGDANGDGTVDVADVVAISAYVGDSEKNPLDEQSILNADVHNTGDGLTANDALMIQQYLSGTVSEL